MQWWVGGDDNGDYRNGHIMPDNDLKEHVSSKDCFCKPRCTMICPTCESSGEACWRCEGSGLVEAEPAERGRLYIHNALDGRD